MTLIARLSNRALLLGCPTLGLAPHLPEPLLVETLRWIAARERCRPVHLCDLAPGTPRPRRCWRCNWQRGGRQGRR
jgi:hypothetical protein